MTASSVTGTGPGSAISPADLEYNIDNLHKVLINNGGNLVPFVELQGENWVVNTPGSNPSGAIILQGTHIQYCTGGNPRGNKAVDLQCCRHLPTQVASGDYSFIAAGCDNTALGKWSHAEGYYNTASIACHAEGYTTTAGAPPGLHHPPNVGCHSEGKGTVALGIASHAEGINTQAGLPGPSETLSADAAHAEGRSTTASGPNSHAEGHHTISSSYSSHAEGSYTLASHADAHAEGYKTIASGFYSHAEGKKTTASGKASHAEGYLSNALGNYSHAEGFYTYASVGNTHAEGNITQATGVASHAEGSTTQATGVASHAECSNTIASGAYAHAEGSTAHATGVASHAECSNTIASGAYAHAEGNTTQAIGVASHAEGSNTIASGAYAHAEGNNTMALGPYTNAGGQQSVASLLGQWTRSSGTFTYGGDAQFSILNTRISTTNNAPTEMFLDGNTATKRMLVPLNTAWSVIVDVIAQQKQTEGTSSAQFVRKCLIQNTSLGVAIVGAVQTIGTDIGSNAGGPPAGWAVTITADTLNESLKITVTGANATHIQWVAKISLTEVTYR